MVRQGATEIDEALLDGALDRVILVKGTGLIGGSERKREVEASAGVIRVSEVAHDVSPHPDLRESLPGSGHHTVVEMLELRPGSGRL